MNLHILVNKHRNKPDDETTLSSESDRGALCLFKLMLPPFSSPASILSCKHNDITDYICISKCQLLFNSVSTNKSEAMAHSLLKIPAYN